MPENTIEFKIDNQPLMSFSDVNAKSFNILVLDTTLKRYNSIVTDDFTLMYKFMNKVPENYIVFIYAKRILQTARLEEQIIANFLLHLL